LFNTANVDLELLQSSVSPGSAPDTEPLSAFLIFDEADGISSRLRTALESINDKKWSLLQLPVDDPIAVSFRVVKLPSMILYTNAKEENARVFGEQNIIEMIGRVFDE
jgi:hypothetical protein